MLKKDLIELCLLHLLAQGEQYGYDLLRRLRDAFPDTQESAIYAILRGLDREDCTEQLCGYNNKRACPEVLPDYGLWTGEI